MNYMVIEFLGVFFLTLFKGIANIAVETKHAEPIANSLVTALVLFIFVVFSAKSSKAMFNPVFPIILNFWGQLSVETTLGYVTVHVLASFLSTSVLTMCLPMDSLSQLNHHVGMAVINQEVDEFSLLTIEISGTFLLFFAYLYCQDSKKNIDPYSAGLFYGLLAGALQLATYKASGGTFNLATVIGGLLFSSIAESKIIYMFFGNILGAFLAKLLYDQTMVQKKLEKESKVIKTMLKR